MKKMLKPSWLLGILVPGLTLCLSCQKDSTPKPAFSATGYWMGSFFSGATMAILNRPDGTGRVYLLTVLGEDTSQQIAKLDGTYTVQGDIFSANYIDSVGSAYMNIQSTRTSLNSMDGVFFLNGFNTAGNTIETFNFEVVKQ